RYYSTSTGNFISQDTYLGDILSGVTLNRYTYANNSPVMYNDPSGHWALWDNITESVSNFANDVKNTVTEGYNLLKSNAANEKVAD
ncbi:MAG: RHS repeat-associated core domain-containing protein, partial [Acutalibacteraceae bacterium]